MSSSAKCQEEVPSWRRPHSDSLRLEDSVLRLCAAFAYQRFRTMNLADGRGILRLAAMLALEPSAPWGSELALWVQIASRLSPSESNTAGDSNGMTCCCIIYPGATDLWLSPVPVKYAVGSEHGQSSRGGWPQHRLSNARLPSHMWSVHKHRCSAARRRLRKGLRRAPWASERCLCKAATSLLDAPGCAGKCVRQACAVASCFDKFWRKVC